MVLSSVKFASDSDLPLRECRIFSFQKLFDPKSPEGFLFCLRWGMFRLSHVEKLLICLASKFLFNFLLITLKAKRIPLVKFHVVRGTFLMLTDPS